MTPAALLIYILLPYRPDTVWKLTQPLLMFWGLPKVFSSSAEDPQVQQSHQLLLSDCQTSFDRSCSLSRPSISRSIKKATSVWPLQVIFFLVAKQISGRGNTGFWLSGFLCWMWEQSNHGEHFSWNVKTDQPGRVYPAGTVCPRSSDSLQQLPDRNEIFTEFLRHVLPCENRAWIHAVKYTRFKN